MTHQVRITKLYKSNTDKNKNPLKTRDGKPYWKIAIRTDKFGEDWYSCLAFREDDKVMQLAEGDEVTIAVEENGQYKNFKLPTRLDLLEERVVKLENALSTLGHTGSTTPNDYPEISDEEIPF